MKSHSVVTGWLFCLGEEPDKCDLKNHEKQPIPFTFESKRYTVEANRTKIITRVESVLYILHLC